MSPPTKQPPLTKAMLNSATASIFRRMLGADSEGGRDYDGECGYPDEITSSMYRDAYERDGVAARVVDVLPDECWAMPPEIYETEEPDKTAWETKFDELCDAEGIDLLSVMHRMDKVSGIGRFGILLLGIDDGKEMQLPAFQIDAKGKPIPNKKEHELLYVRCFDESLVTIAQTDTDIKSPRYGCPLIYNIMMGDPRMDNGTASTSLAVHWTRVVHLADNRLSSEHFGAPRMKVVWNRLHDLKKIGGGSGEMFWRGGFPGYSFETPADGTMELDIESMRSEFEMYSNSLQRYLAFQGVQTKVLSPNLASPKEHLEGQLKLITITIGVPMRVFLGSEEAKISSTQDGQTWNKRLGRRQNYYITPKVIKPVIYRLMDLGVLPRIEKLVVAWPDLNTSTDTEKSETAAKWTTAIATYVGSGCDQFMPPREFLIYVMKMPPDVADQIMDAADKYTPQFVASVPDNGGGANNAPAPAEGKPTPVNKAPKAITGPPKADGKPTKKALK